MAATLVALVACNRDAAFEQGRQALGSCGNGIWEPAFEEECDPDPDNESEACSSACDVQDILVKPPVSSRVERYTGTSRHPSAVSSSGFAVSFLEVPGSTDPGAEEVSESPPFVGIQLFNRDGGRTDAALLSEGARAIQGMTPSVAGLSDGSFAAVFSGARSDDDELELLLRRVASNGSLGTLEVANEVTIGAQYDSDIIRAGEEVIVAWTDESNPLTAPDVRFRRFDEQLDAESNEETLAETEAIEGGVVLSAAGSSWAAAWQAGQLDGTEQIVVEMPDEAAAGPSRV